LESALGTPNSISLAKRTHGWPKTFPKKSPFFRAPDIATQTETMIESKNRNSKKVCPFWFNLVLQFRRLKKVIDR
jgi:hypothetical protein